MAGGKEGVAMPTDISVANDGNKSDEEIVTNDALIYEFLTRHRLNLPLLIIDYYPPIFRDESVPLQPLPL